MMLFLFKSVLFIPLLLFAKLFYPATNQPSTATLVSAALFDWPLFGGGGSGGGNKLKWHKPATTISSIDLHRLVSTTTEDYVQFNQTLQSIMIPRVVGTPGHERVQKFIQQYLSTLAWTVELDRFESDTPHGRKQFTNIIATQNPRACRRVVLACHYDSKYFESFDFVAASDSAVPCTMILELLRILRRPLAKHSTTQSEVTLQVIFFDGEEAFKEWSHTDSLYGARHLASRMSLTKYSVDDEAVSACSGVTAGGGGGGTGGRGNRRRGGGSGSGSSSFAFSNDLDRIELFILLDLIGEASPQFCSHSTITKPLFDRLTNIERRLNQRKLLQTRRSGGSGTKYFPKYCLYSGQIEDDHIPFEQNGVPVLHLIATPFPQFWHTSDDNGNNMHHPTINNLMKIFRIFFIEYFNLYVDNDHDHSAATASSSA